MVWHCVLTRNAGVGYSVARRCASANNAACHLVHPVHPVYPSWEEDGMNGMDRMGVTWESGRRETGNRKQETGIRDRNQGV